MAIYLGNVAFEAEDDDLRALIEEHAQLKHLIIVRDRKTGRSKGFAFATLVEEEREGDLIEMLDGFDFRGRNLRAIKAHTNTQRLPSEG